MGAGVEKRLVDLGERVVAVDRHAHVHALNREREARRALVARTARRHGTDPERRWRCRAIGRRQTAGPIVPAQHRRNLHAAVLERQLFAGSRATFFGAHFTRSTLTRMLAFGSKLVIGNVPYRAAQSAEIWILAGGPAATKERLAAKL